MGVAAQRFAEAGSAKTLQAKELAKAVSMAKLHVNSHLELSRPFDLKFRRIVPSQRIETSGTARGCQELRS